MHKVRQVNVRMTDEDVAMLDGIRRAAARSGDQIPTVGEIMRTALHREYERIVIMRKKQKAG
jgi:hypothetical protein